MEKKIKDLTKEECDYLRAVCKPYKVEYIRKVETLSGSQFILIVVKSSIYYSATERWSLPYFKKDTMYKGMKVDRNYTIEELGIC